MALLGIRQGAEALLDDGSQKTTKVFMHLVMHGDLSNVALEYELMFSVEHQGMTSHSGHAHEVVTDQDDTEIKL